jgi:DNA modification methylase
MNLETVAIDTLTPDPKNARLHERGVPELAESLTEFGQRKNLVVWHDVVISGNGLMLAAQSLGWSEIEIDRVPDEWTYEKAQAYAIIDNKTAELSTWDLPVLSEIRFELDAVGWDTEKFGFEPLKPPVFFGDKDPDDVPDIPEVPKSKVGDRYQLGEHVLICGDATDVDVMNRLMGGGMADMVFTDPPYGISRDQGFGGSVGFGGKGKPIARKRYEGNWDVAIPSQETFDLFLGRGEVVMVFGGNFFMHRLPQGNHWVVWDKKNTMPTFGDAELIWTNVKRNSVKVRSFEFNGLIGKETERFHATQKPVALLVDLIVEYSPGPLVLDPFGGSGSTLIACEQMGRQCRMIEIDPRYVDVIIKRWENLTGKKARKVR